MLLTLNNYRCFEHIQFDLPDTNFVLLDENGSGKTSILSAFYSLYTGQPLPSTKFGQYLKLGSQYFGISTTDSDWFLNGKISPSGRVVAKYSNPNISDMTILTYQPTDNYWLSQSRGTKLQILDGILSQTSSGYSTLLKHLDKLIKSKLELLKQSNITGQNDEVMIKYLGQTINELSHKIWSVRCKFLIHIDTHLSQFEALINNRNINWQINWEITDIAGRKKTIRNIKDFDFESSFKMQNIDIDFMLLWQKELICEKVLFGAHRDDFEIVSNRLSIEQILSRGEMRLFVLWVKKLGTVPNQTIWLLDDIFNELDDTREKILLDQVFVDSHQIIATGTRCNLDNLAKFKVSELII
jgi:DNA replication and repair protein RecF